MATTIEYALLAGEAYQDTRAAINCFPIPNEWVVYSRVPESSTSGFEASAYQRGTEIVISYAGTGTAIDHVTNVALALGNPSSQLAQTPTIWICW